MSTSNDIDHNSTNDPSPSYLDTKITLENYRTLLGLPSSPNALHPSRLPRWWRSSQHHNPDADDDTEELTPPHGIYPTLLTLEHRTTVLLNLHTLLTTGGLLTQLILSALLILLAAVPSNHNIAIAIFGALNGIVTGGLALVNGRGYEERLGAYLEGLRAVRERVEWVEKELVGELREVQYREVVGLKERFEGVRRGKGEE